MATIQNNQSAVADLEKMLKDFSYDFRIESEMNGQGGFAVNEQYRELQTQLVNILLNYQLLLKNDATLLSRADSDFTSAEEEAEKRIEKIGASGSK
jgi:phosphopantothenoylcysteine synthetase/decarboxylase